MIAAPQFSSQSITEGPERAAAPVSEVDRPSGVAVDTPCQGDVDEEVMQVCALIGPACTLCRQ